MSRTREGISARSLTLGSGDIAAHGLRAQEPTGEAQFFSWAMASSAHSRTSPTVLVRRPPPTHAPLARIPPLSSGVYSSPTITSNSATGLGCCRRPEFERPI